MKRRWIAEDKLPYVTDVTFPQFVRDGVLVRIVDTEFHVLDSRLDYDGEYIRPHVLTALRPFETAFRKKFGHPIRINSAFRSREHHADLRGRNPNAAQGDSPHSTGCTVDISRIAMTAAEQKFTERWFWARHGKSLVFTIEHRPLSMYDVFFRPPKKLPPKPRHPAPKKRR
jgi:hypothetical protein